MTDAASSTAIIIGAGHAGGELAVSLRNEGWSGRILLIGEEAHLPYHRPPLSKAYLAGTVEKSSLSIRPQAAYDKANVEFIGGVRVSLPVEDRPGSIREVGDSRDPQVLVGIVTVGAFGAQRGGAHMGAYAASKAALQRLTESMSAELKGQGLHVNCVLPSIIDTADNRAAMPDADPSQWVAPAALADVIAFLGSDAARAIHGASIPVTGLV